MHREQKSGYYIMGSPQQLSLQQHDLWMIRGHLIHPNYKLLSLIFKVQVVSLNLNHTEAR